MNFIEHHETIEKALPDLKFSTTYIGAPTDFPYLAKNLGVLRRSVNLVEDIPYLEREITILKQSCYLNLLPILKR